MDTTATDCYNVRQVSPFVGSIQIIQADYCRALSSDGIQWQIQASCETHQQVWKVTADNYIPRRYVLYGSWNQQQGFSSLPLDPMLDVPDVTHVENTLISRLQHCAADLPFTPRDTIECWAIDRLSGSPLALLASAINEHEIPHIQIRPWQAMPQQQSSGNLPDQLTTASIMQLESAINSQAGQHTWFRRLPDGTGEALSAPAQTIAAIQFPQLLFNPDLLPQALQTIIDDYINWQSPRLLTLAGISTSTRQQLELAAQHYAVETCKRQAIYPVPLNKKIHNKIMVELKLRGL